MIIFRIISLLFVAGALMVLGADALTSLENGAVTLRPLNDVIALVSRDLAAAIADWQGALPGGLKEGVGYVLTSPAWVPLGVIGIFLAFLFRARD